MIKFKMNSINLSLNKFIFKLSKEYDFKALFQIDNSTKSDTVYTYISYITFKNILPLNIIKKCFEVNNTGFCRILLTFQNFDIVNILSNVYDIPFIQQLFNELILYYINLTDIKSTILTDCYIMNNNYFHRVIDIINEYLLNNFIFDDFILYKFNNSKIFYVDNCMYALYTPLTLIQKLYVDCKIYKYILCQLRESNKFELMPHIIKLFETNKYSNTYFLSICLQLLNN